MRRVAIVELVNGNVITPVSNRAMMMAGTPTGTVAGDRTLPPVARVLWWLPGGRLSNGEAMPDRAALIEAQNREGVLAEKRQVCLGVTGGVLSGLAGSCGREVHGRPTAGYAP